jgi:hypothetical protein
MMAPITPHLDIHFLCDLSHTRPGLVCVTNRRWCSEARYANSHLESQLLGKEAEMGSAWAKVSETLFQKTSLAGDSCL